MSSIVKGVEFILHFDKYLGSIIQSYGGFVYGILFLIVFLETGLVVTPFLPGDSLLFVVGAFSASGFLNLGLIILLLCIAAILGDSVNYAIGRYLGPRIFKHDNHLLFKKEYLTKTEKFYEKYGSKTIILARFVPIVRTFAPFVAGMGRMEYKKFFMFNVIGGCIWVLIFVLAGYYFGNIPIIKENLTIVVLCIIVLSCIPPLIEYFRTRNKN